MVAFIVHAWNFKPASLYPHRCDGIEYIDSVIRTIQRVFKDTNNEIRLDSTSFIAGETIRNNLQTQLRDAELIIVLLDGLRPNVLYEMGYAAALDSTKILCLCEENATVLVRNYYPNPLSVPTTSGKFETIENPKLNIASAFSDCSDILTMTYDRFNLDHLYDELKKYINNLTSTSCTKAVQDSVSNVEMEKEENATETSNTDEINQTNQNSDANNYHKENIWELFRNKKYDQIELIDITLLSSEEQQVKGMAFMIQKKYSKAIDIFNALTKEKGKLKSSSVFFLGLCYLAQKRYFEAFVNLIHAKKLNYQPDNGEVDELIDICATKVDYEEWRDLFNIKEDH